LAERRPPGRGYLARLVEPGPAGGVGAVRAPHRIDWPSAGEARPPARAAVPPLRAPGHRPGSDPIGAAGPTTAPPLRPGPSPVESVTRQHLPGTDPSKTVRARASRGDAVRTPPPAATTGNPAPPEAAVLRSQRAGAEPGRSGPRTEPVATTLLRPIRPATTPVARHGAAGDPGHPGPLEPPATIHIGSIEVRVLPAPVPAPAPAARPRPARPTTRARLSRPGSSFGLGQV
jgi:hypothetical protein